MATVVITFRSACAGGDHLRVDVDVNGTAVTNVPLEANEILVPLSTSEASEIVTDLLRIRFKGKTRAEARADLLAGITMTI